MSRTPAQRGSLGRWLKRIREDRYPTQAAALAEMRRLAGLAISPSEYAQWESGSRVPREDNPKLARLYEFFGSRPEADLPEPVAVSEPQAIVAALDRLTAAVQALGEQRSSDMALLAQMLGSALGLPEGRPGHTQAGAPDRESGVGR